MAATLAPPPAKLGVTHWSSRLLGRHLGIGNKTVATAWMEYGIQPWRSETFKFSTDPELVAKVTDVVGLYVEPPQNAVVLCVDEKSQIQALDRTAPMLPGLPQRRTHDYRRHGTTTLFAALEIATGQVTAACKPRHRRQEFLAFLKQVAKDYPDRELHLVMDNYAAHKKVEVRDWLGANPRVHVHFTPTSGSWLNLVEVWFGIIERQAIHRGTFRSVADLNAKICAFITGWNDRKHPFVWAKTADDILKKANRSNNFKHGPLAAPLCATNRLPNRRSRTEAQVIPFRQCSEKGEHSEWAPETCQLRTLPCDIPSLRQLCLHRLDASAIFFRSTSWIRRLLTSSFRRLRPSASTGWNSFSDNSTANPIASSIACWVLPSLSDP